MKQGEIIFYYGDKKAKTIAAVGRGVYAVADARSVIMVRFACSEPKTTEPLKKLEPDFKIFAFGKPKTKKPETDEEKAELLSSTRLAFNFSKKIIETGECDMLILDCVTDVVLSGFLEETELIAALEKKRAYMDVVMTGSQIPENLAKLADCMYKVSEEIPM